MNLTVSNKNNNNKIKKILFNNRYFKTKKNNHLKMNKK